MGIVGLTVFGSAMCGVGGHILGVYWNGSEPVDVSRVSKGWTVNKSFLDEPNRNPETYRDLLQQHCAPMGNGWRILFNQAWYNTITDGYDETVWLESDESYGYYALYNWGPNVFLRNGFAADNYHNRVLTCELPGDGWPI